MEPVPIEQPAVERHRVVRVAHQAAQPRVLPEPQLRPGRVGVAPRGRERRRARRSPPRAGRAGRSRARPPRPARSARGRGHPSWCPGCRRRAAPHRPRAAAPPDPSDRREHTRLPALRAAPPSRPGRTRPLRCWCRRSPSRRSRPVPAGRRTRPSRRDPPQQPGPHRRYRAGTCPRPPAGSGPAPPGRPSRSPAGRARRPRQPAPRPPCP